MKNMLKFAVALSVYALTQTASADQQFSYSEAFSGDNGGSFVLTGVFNETPQGTLTSLSANILENGDSSFSLQNVSISSSRYINLPDSVNEGFPLQIDGWFDGASNNLNTITSCGQIYLTGTGCADWQANDPSIVSQGLTDIRTAGPVAGGDQLSNDFFSQTSAIEVTQVPEPGSMLLMLAGLAAFFMLRTNRRHM